MVVGIKCSTLKYYKPLRPCDMQAEFQIFTNEDDYSDIRMMLVKFAKHDIHQIQGDKEHQVRGS